MALQANWATKVITVSQSDLTLIIGTRYQISVDFWYLLVRELNGSTQGIVETVNAPLFKNTSPTTTTPRIVDIINGYTVQFEVGSYSVEFVDGNTNIREVEIKNIVSVGSNNTSALINPTILEAGVYAGKIAVSPTTGVPGVGKTPQGDLIGTLRAPSNNMPEALLIAAEQGSNTFLVLDDVTLNEDYSAGFNFEGDSPFNVITCNAAANLIGAFMYNLTVVGELDGINVLRACQLNTVTNASGLIDRSSLSETITLIGNTLIADCVANTGLTGSPIIIGGAGILVETRNFSGTLEIRNTIDTINILDGKGGELIIDSSCIGGMIHARGDWFKITDNSGPGCTVLDERSTGGTGGGGVTPQNIIDIAKRVWDENL